MTDRNLGKFVISAIIIRDNPDRVAEIFGILKVVAIRTEMFFHSDTIEYTAISERFPEVNHGESIPKYTLVIRDDEDGSVESVEIVPAGS